MKSGFNAICTGTPIGPIEAETIEFVKAISTYDSSKRSTNMKKSLTLAFVLANLAVFSGLGVAQQGEKQKSPTTRDETKPSPTPPVPLKTRNFETKKVEGEVRKATSPQVTTGKVTQVNAREKTFAVEVSFSAGSMKGDYTFKVGETIDVAYTQTPGGPMLATSVKSSKSNSSDRETTSAQVMTGKLTQVNAREKTFAIEVSFSAAKLGTFPALGQIVDVTYTKDPNGRALAASNLNSSKSNIY